MSSVQGGDACCPEAFGDCDQAGVCAAKGHVLVAVDEFTNARPIRCGERLDGGRTVNDCVVERRFGCHGPPVIRGLRYPVELILELLASGMSPDEILADYADLEQDDLLAALEYGALASGVRRVLPLTAA